MDPKRDKMDPEAQPTQVPPAKRQKTSGELSHNPYGNGGHGPNQQTTVEHLVAPDHTNSNASSSSNAADMSPSGTPQHHIITPTTPQSRLQSKTMVMPMKQSYTPTGFPVPGPMVGGPPQGPIPVGPHGVGGPPYTGPYPPYTPHPPQHSPTTNPPFQPHPPYPPHPPHPPHGPGQYPFRPMYPRPHLPFHYPPQAQSPPRPPPHLHHPIPPPNPPPTSVRPNRTVLRLYRMWTESQVLDWFKNTFPFADKYLEVFKECAVDGPSLDELTDEILQKDLNMDDPNHRNAILSSVDVLKSAGRQGGLISPSLAPAQGIVMDDQLKEAIQHIVQNGDLNHLTKKQIRHSLETRFGCSLVSRAPFISKEIVRVLSIQEDLEEKKRQHLNHNNMAPPMLGHPGVGNEAFTHNCHYCKMRFINPQKLISHMNTHKAILPFECQTCGQRSKRRDKNERHEATAHRHVCPVCNKAFVWKRHSRFLSLEYHLEEAHGMS